MILKGEKIYLKEGLREADYELILKGYTDLSVVGFVSFAKKSVELKTVAEAKKFFHEIEPEIVFGIYNSDDKFIGYTSLEKIEDDEYEFSVLILNKDYWGKGIGEEASRMTLNYAFNDLGAKKVVLYTSEFHDKAIALYERMGFQKTKTIPNDREIYMNGQWIKSGTVEMEKISN
ncbi:MAG: GNAT family N-acetyltransferase [Candidatus Pacebacteria bacterium]|nr:GNAT family N-acetyltransferase [Candidatus Paceibacterota bacterium]